MSVNIYLKPEVAQLPGYVSSPDMGLGKLSGLSVYLENGRHLFIPSSSLEFEVPQVVAELVDEISVRECFPAYGYGAGTREMGVYRHESAEATIDLINSGSSKKISMSYRVHLTAKKMEDARELIHLFRTGKLRPTESYEGPAEGKSRSELEAEVRLLKEKLERREGKIKLQEIEAARLAECSKTLREYLDRLAEDLRKSRSGLCWAGDVAKRVRKISAGFPNQ